MPTYEYKCLACGNEFEVFQSMSADPIKKCPACKKNKVKRLISTGAGLIFKGSGFYITDYRDQGYKDKAKADSAPAPTTETKPAGDGKPGTDKPATKSEPAPAAKTESKPPEGKSGKRGRNKS